MEEIITKRLHISGLTPSIIPDDLSKRFSNFGTVKAMDGFGLLDAVGQPRKFGYVTLETTKKNFSRCMNMLSGVTWKGAKLRIGEAKPDLHERVAKEHESLKRAAEEAVSDRSMKRRRLPRGVQGVHAADMSLVTPGNVATRPGWRVTALGRLIRPIRTRPLHPLPPLLQAAAAHTGSNKGKGKEIGKKKTRVKIPPTRARRRTIDSTKWGSEHLKGVFLEDAIVAPIVRENAPAVEAVENTSVDAEEVSESEEETSEDEAGLPEGRVIAGNEAPKEGPCPIPSTSSTATLASRTQTRQDDGVQSDLQEETQKSLGLLHSLFGGKKDEDWYGKESVGSDVDGDRAPLLDDAAAENEDDDERNELAEASAMHDEDEDVLPAVENQPVEGSGSRKPPAPVQTTKLKDLFALRAEDVSFSILGHLDLDLDLELDEEVDPHLPIQTPALADPTPTSAAPPLPSLPFDPKTPMFFPLPEEERGRGRVHDVLDPTNWRTWFYRTDSAEDIQRRWEETKGELTSGWKRRHREAVKSRRRRGGGPGDSQF